MIEGALQPEVLWGSRKNDKFAATNILTNEASDFSNSTHSNYWLAERREVKGQGFVMRVGNSRRKIVGVHIRNTCNTSNGYWATRSFQLQGSLLKEPEIGGVFKWVVSKFQLVHPRLAETIAQRAKENTAHWTPDLLKTGGKWEELLNATLEDNQTQIQTFFFDSTTELRYLWFHLLSFYGKGGGLQYFAPILQSGEFPIF